MTYLEDRAALAARTDLRGRDFCHALSQRTDEWLAGLFEAAADGVTGAIALVAAGGYGRGQLAPGSDLDVWLLHADQPGIASVADRLWYPVWDTGLQLGHAVRTVRQALALAADDLDTATALLALRPIAGDGDLAAELAERARQQWRKRWKRWLPELTRRASARHAASGEVAFLLEPDIKDGRGGLRDVHALDWAGVAAPVLLEGDSDALADAHDVLLDARVELHRATGRATDRLVLERQDEVAAALGFGDADELMAGIAGAARTISWIGDEAWGRARSAAGGPLGRVFRRDRPVGEGLVLRDGQVHVDTAVEVSAVTLLRAAASAAWAETRIDRASLDRLAAGVKPLDGAWPDGARDALVELLAAGHRAIPVLEALDQRRLIERILPEWSTVRSRPQRNAYHRFTVDRHLCEAAANAATLTARVARPDLLLVGAWLHDIGKGIPERDHTDAGVELVAGIARRMGFGTADVDVLTGLVRHHLLLADAATRRDIEDDATVAVVAAATETIPFLELLEALTEADSLATGSSAWSPWKADLVAQLTARVAHVLRGGAASDIPRRDFPSADVLRLAAAGEIVVRGEGDTLTVVARDRPGLFSQVSGALSLSGLDVLAADADSDDDGTAMSQFRVEAKEGGDVDWTRVTERVRQAVEGDLPVEERLAARVRQPGGVRAKAAAAPRTHVHVDNHASGSATVVEVRAPDDAGVLYRITRAMAALGLDIRHAKVQTLGHEVVDAFYVRGPGGGKVTGDGDVHAVERAILDALAG